MKKDNIINIEKYKKLRIELIAIMMELDEILPKEKLEKVVLEQLSKVRGYK